MEDSEELSSMLSSESVVESYHHSHCVRKHYLGYNHCLRLWLSSCLVKTSKFTQPRRSTVVNLWCHQLLCLLNYARE